MKAIVIGAGLSGAAVANALAQRDAQVTVLDAARAPAAGASSLPAGLMAPQVSKDDGIASQLIRLGIARTTAECERLLRRGIDWEVCGALYKPFKAGKEALWHPEAAWVKPAALVRAWLAGPGIEFVGNAQVQRITNVGTPAAPDWQVFGQTSSGVSPTKTTLLASAQAIVIAAASGTHAVTQFLRPATAKPMALHSVTGQVIFGPWTTDWEQTRFHRGGSELGRLHTSKLEPSEQNYHALNGNGHFIPNIASDAGDAPPFWLSGSTYEHGVDHPSVTRAGLRANSERLAQLLPAAAPLLAAAAQSGQLHAWAGERCTTADRLPAAGALDATALPGLYVCAGMGSRGLSFAALCAEYLAQNVFGEPISLAPCIQKALLPARLYGQTQVKRL